MKNFKNNTTVNRGIVSPKTVIKAEWFKLTKSTGFKALLVINLIAAVLLMWALTKAEQARTGYTAFRLGIAYVFYHTNIGLIFTAIFICEDFSSKSFGTSLLSGCSRGKIFFAKVIIFLAGMLILFSDFVCTAVIASSLLNGFGMTISMEACKNILFFTFCGILGCISISSVMILFSVIVKRKIPTIIVTYLFFYPLEFLKNNYRFYDNADGILKFLKCTYLYQIYTMFVRGDGGVVREFEFQPEMFFPVNIVTIILALVISQVIFEKIELK